MTFAERAFDFESDGLRLEGALHEGEGALAAVVPHPHPQYGGDMDNHVVLAVCGALAAAGATTLRFNFRGTGHSQGAFDNGRGEAADARAAIGAVRGLRPGAPIVLAGYSFGALVAAGIAGQEELRALILVSPPAAFAPLPPLPDGVDTLLVTGEYDDLAPPGWLRALEGPTRRLVVVPEAGHAWWPGVESLASEIASFLGVLEAGNHS
ncbi:MAG: alpha/beta fold hydrolase [Chloroflexi bacterium]|nr:alpha/beta fold hydrolase [Chloroflexota bacterium]